MSRQILASRLARDKFPTRISLAFGLVTLVLLIAQRFAFIKTEVDVPMGWPQDPFRNRSLLFLILERGVLPGWGLHLILFVVGGVFFPRSKWILWLVLLLWFLVVWLALLAHVPVYSWWYRARIARGIDPDNDPTENGNLKKFLGFSIAALVLAVAELVFACVDQCLGATSPPRKHWAMAYGLEAPKPEDLKPDTDSDTEAPGQRPSWAGVLNMEAIADLKPEDLKPDADPGTGAPEGFYDQWMREQQKLKEPEESGPGQHRKKNKGKGRAVDNEEQRKNPENVRSPFEFKPRSFGRLSMVVEGGSYSERGTVREEIPKGYFRQ